MYSSLVDVADSGLEKGGRLGVLNALSMWRSEGPRQGETPIEAEQARVARSTLALHARLGERQVSRVLGELLGETGGPILIRRIKRGTFHKASVYEFYDDRFLRVATAARLARRAVRAGLTKRVMAMDLIGREATAENCQAMVEACIWACEREDKTTVVKTLQSLAEIPFEDHFLGDVPRGGNGTLCPQVMGHLRQGNGTFAAGSPTPPIRITPQGFQSAGERVRAKPDPLPAEQTCDDVSISALAREVGAPAEMIDRLRETTWRREADTGRLIVVARSPWVRDKLLGMRQMPLLKAARLLGLEGVEVRLEVRS